MNTLIVEIKDLISKRDEMGDDYIIAYCEIALEDKSLDIHTKMEIINLLDKFKKELE